MNWFIVSAVEFTRRRCVAVLLTLISGASDVARSVTFRTRNYCSTEVKTAQVRVCVRGGWGDVAGGENTGGQDLRIRVRGGNRLCGVADRLCHPPTYATMMEASAVCASARRWPRRWGCSDPLNLDMWADGSPRGRWAAKVGRHLCSEGKLLFTLSGCWCFWPSPHAQAEESWRWSAVHIRV